MGNTSAPVFPYPTGVQGKEPADPVAGKPGHFAWSRWIKEFVKRLDRESVKISGDTMTGPLALTNGNVEVQLYVDNTGMTVTGPIEVQEPTRPTDVTTKQYVDAKLSSVLNVQLSGGGTGWAAVAQLPEGAVVTALVDVHTTRSSEMPGLAVNPTTNEVFVGVGATRNVRIVYIS